MNNATSDTTRKAAAQVAAPAATTASATGAGSALDVDPGAGPGARPGADDPRLEALLAHLERLVPPAERPAFRRAMVADVAVDVRLNPLLPWARSLAGALQARGDSPSWNDHVFRLPDDGGTSGPDRDDNPNDGSASGISDDDAAPGDSARGVGHSLEFRLGALYIQARATTLAVSLLDPQPGELVLDLAAAPGGKATQIAAAMANTGVLVANEPRSRRLSSLVGNLERCGAHNTLITSIPGAELARHCHNAFDRVLLDAPCSGDGIVCKDRGMLNWWSPADAVRKSVQQIGLLRAAFHMLRPGGRLVYSTCSLSIEENEAVLLGLEKRYPGQVDILPITALAGGRLATEVVAAYPEAVGRARRVWPHEHDTEGAFVALIGKRGETAWDPVLGDAGAILRESLGGPAPDSTDPGLPASDSVRGHDPDGWVERIAERWDVAPSVPPGHELAEARGHLHLRPAAAARLEAEPWLVRAGMRLAGLHKGHFYLSQQAVSLWGHLVEARRLELTWPQVQTLFRGEPLEPAPASPIKGEVLCVHDGIPLCRAVRAADGSALSGYVPKVARTPHLHRLLQ